MYQNYLLTRVEVDKKQNINLDNMKRLDGFLIEINISQSLGTEAESEKSIFKHNLEALTVERHVGVKQPRETQLFPFINQFLFLPK